MWRIGLGTYWFDADTPSGGICRTPDLCDYIILIHVGYIKCKITDFVGYIKSQIFPEGRMALSYDWLRCISISLLPYVVLIADRDNKLSVWPKKRIQPRPYHNINMPLPTSQWSKYPGIPVSSSDSIRWDGPLLYICPAEWEGHNSMFWNCNTLCHSQRDWIVKRGN